MKTQRTTKDQNKPGSKKRHGRIEHLVKRYFSLAEHHGPDSLEDSFEQEKILHVLKSRIAGDKARKAARWKIAASFIGFMVLSGLAAWLYINPGDTKPEPLMLSAQNAHIQPGGNQAILTLSDGRTIDLGTQVNGQIAKQLGTQISKTEEGMLIYQPESGVLPHEASYNTISTPRGGQYAVVLPDGSKVWLNASSVLKYPTAFPGDSRIVELKGEGYFEIKHNPSKPFKVKSQGQTITVLGTKFNVNSYSNEPSMRTTLLEGSVQIEQGAQKAILKPGQQARVQKDIQVSSVNTRKFMAWKHGDFIFKNDGIQEVMRQVARWYDIEVDYQGLEQASSLRFGGIVSRTQELSTVLTMLEATGRVKFKLIIDAQEDQRRLQVTII